METEGSLRDTKCGVESFMQSLAQDRLVKTEPDLSKRSRKLMSVQESSWATGEDHRDEVRMVSNTRQR